MIKSEFDPYSNLTYVYLDKFNNGFCLENGRYIRQRSLSEAVESTARITDSQEVKSNLLAAKMELCFIAYKDN